MIIYHSNDSAQGHNVTESLSKQSYCFHSAQRQSVTKVTLQKFSKSLYSSFLFSVITITVFSAVVLYFMCPITFLFSTAKCLYSVRNIYGFPICLLLCEIYICPQYLSIIILPFCRKSKHLKGPPIGASSLSSCEPFDVHIYISMYIYVNLPRYIYFTVHIIFVLHL